MRIDPELYPWLSVCLIAWGLLDCFLGYRVFKATVAVWGVILGACIGHAAAVALGLMLTGQIGGAVIGALLGTGVAFMLYLAAVFIAGLFFGLTLGLLLFSNYNPNMALLAGCGLGLVSGFVAIKLQKVLLILATALLGSFRALLALMYFTHQTDWAFYLLQQPRQIPALIDNTPWLLPVTLTLAVAGALSQFGLKDNGVTKKNRAEDTGMRK